MRVLGVDPGLRVTGYGCVEGPEGTRLVEAGVIRLRAPTAEGVGARLVELERDLAGILERLAPALVAVEGLFAHPKHPATAAAMAHARGVILLQARRAGVRVLEVKPAAVKKALTGSGQASKPQVQRAVQARFGLPEPPRPPDVADALAIAVCAAWHEGWGAGGAAADIPGTRSPGA
jgi:crossover junction endodeoxyribonuclease RuvC